MSKRTLYLVAVITALSLFEGGLQRVATATDTRAVASVALSRNEIVTRLIHSNAWIRVVGKKGEVSYSFTGTGWILDAERRLIVTNDHVVTGHQFVEVYFPTFEDGRLVADPNYYLEEVDALKGTVIACDRVNDLAVIQVESVPSTARALALSTESPVPGETLHVVGAYSKGSEALWGYAGGPVRQVCRRTLANDQTSWVVETQIPTNQGNSGGAVVNDRGELVAVVEGHSVDARLVSLFIDVRVVRGFVDEVEELIDPQSVEAFNLRGNLHREHGRLNLAMADFTAAWRLDRTNATTLANRALTQLLLGDWATAEADVLDALAKDADSPHANLVSGIILYYSNQPEPAIRAFSEAIRRDPAWAAGSAYQWRAAALREVGNYQSALADHARGIEIAPESHEQYLELGKTQWELGEYQEALGALTKSLKLNPTSGEILNWMGICFDALNDLETATACYTKALQFDPFDEILFVNRAMTLRERERFDLAIKDHLQAVRLAPKYWEAHLELGITLMRMEQFKFALQAFDRAATLAPQDPFVFQLRAECHAALGNQQASAADLARAAELQSAARG